MSVFKDDQTTYTGNLTVLGTLNAGTGTRIPRTGNYTVINSDEGSVIALGGNSFYTLTFNAASGYDANFSVIVLNEDSVSAKTMAINGIANFFLYPGQSIMVFNQNNVWQTLGRSHWIIASDITIYCNQSTGSDTNDGLTISTPKASVIAALYQIISDFNYDSSTTSIPIVTILMGANDTTGAHFASQGLANAVGGGSITLDGGGFTMSCGADTDSALHLFFGLVMYIQNIIIKGGTNHGGLTLERGTKIFLRSNVTFAATTGSAQIQIEDGASLEVDANYTIAGSAGIHVFCQNLGAYRIPSPITITFSANAAFTWFVIATNMGLIDFTNATISLGAFTVTGKRWEADNLSLVVSNTGVPDTYFPGNVNGTTSGGGQGV